MQKIIVWVVGVAIVLIIGFYVFNSYIYNEKQEEERQESITSEGVITSINVEGAAVDGPALVAIETPSGDIENIIVPTFGLSLCTAFENIEDVFAMEVGQYIELSGYESTDGGIIPCDSLDHYLRVRI